MRITPIAAPLPGEHLATTFPVIRPETNDARWRLRLDFWAGRSLTAEALDLEQENRAARLAWRGRVSTPGVVSGLEVALETPPAPQDALSPEGYFVHVLPGFGFMPDGEDVVIPHPLRAPLDQLPVHYVRVGGPDRSTPAEAPPDGATAGPPRDAGGYVFNVDRFDAGRVSWAAVLLLCPAELPTFERVDPHDPCELDPSRDAFADERRLDGCTLRLVELPVAWQALPELSEPDDPRWRNRLAHVVLTEEARGSARHQIRFLQAEPSGRRWDTVSREVSIFPWDLLGVPLALVSSEAVPDAAARRYFLDRASVVRPGGLSRPRMRPALRIATSESEAALNPLGAGAPLTWRARVDQFAEHLGLFQATTAAEVSALTSRFQFVPSTGFLPRSALTFLTTAQAQALPALPGQSPDRAGMNHFFPSSIAVEAVPVAMEDLDAVLASSASLVPYDLASTSPDFIRMVVPLPQRVFDPYLLMVELEDPIFAATVARFMAARQDWRQRRDAVRSRRNTLQALTAGPQTVGADPDLDPGQFEPEPVETPALYAASGLESARLSPAAPSGPVGLSVTLSAARTLSAGATLFARLRADRDALPDRIDVRWRAGSQEFPFSWSEPPTPASPPVDPAGAPLPIELWFRYTVTAADLGAIGAAIDGVSVRIESGRVGIASLGQLVPGQLPGDLVEDAWWRAQDATPMPEFSGGDWTTIGPDRLFAPFEDPYLAVFPDGRLEAARIADVNAALNPAGVTPRTPAMTVASHGLERAIDELEAEASEADDFIDTYFTRAQVNLYRIRKLVLGETAAQKLLINPAIAMIADQETASASAEQFSTFITRAKTRSISRTLVNPVLNPPSISSIAPTSGRQGDSVTATVVGTNLGEVTALRFSGTGVTATIQARSAGSMRVAITIATTASPDARTMTALAGEVPSQPFSSFGVRPAGVFTPIGLRVLGEAAPLSFVPARRSVSLDRALVVSGFATVTATEAKLDTLKDVFGQRPETGPTLPPRGLSIGQRFVEPPATQNLSYARSALVQFLNQLPRLRLPLAGQAVRSVSGQDVSLLELQGRAVGNAENTSEELRTAALARLLTVTALTADTDEAEVTLAALDFTEIKSAILRTIERVAQEHRTVIQNGVETLRLLGVQRDSAAVRVQSIDGRLAEARHDVSVAQALRQEEQQRVTALNDRRDALIRDEVRFLAYVRPRTVDTVRRNTHYWKLEAASAQAPVPACLQRHDEPPAPLNAYIQLFRHAPARWFTALQPLLSRLDTSEKLIALLDESRLSAATFASADTANVLRGSVEAVQLTVLGAHRAIGALRQRSTAIQTVDKRTQRWQDVRREAEEHASVGDLISGRHGSREVSAASTLELEQIGKVATCLHAEFAAVAPAIRLAWIERFSQFDRPVLLRDLTVLPHYGRLDRATRRRLQEYADWLFGRINVAQGDPVALINDMIRLCLLLASHAPVNRIIAGHVPRPTPVRPGLQIPIRPLNPELVRVGMEFHVWQASRIVARGHVEDLQQGEVSARVEKVDAQTTVLDSSMRVQFVASALSLIK